MRPLGAPFHLKTMPATQRLDVALVERGLVDSREKAQRLIMAGKVRVNDVPAGKASVKVRSEDVLRVLEDEKFVSRGGYKLEAALQQFAINCAGWICLDVGASTGGFTDCLLQHGAKRVFAVDVGENQIAWKLRSDPRVRVLDHQNARYLDRGLVDETVDFVTADVSFISVCKVLPAVLACAKPDAQAVILIKPQFEAGREHVGEGGVVRDSRVHEQVVMAVRAFVEQELKAVWRGVIQSPLEGPAGNKEFLAWFQMHSD